MIAFRMRIATVFTAAAVLATSFIPVSAAPVMPAAPMAVQTSANQATEVQYRHDRDRRYYRHDRDRRHYRHERRAYRQGYYNGHRGYASAAAATVTTTATGSRSPHSPPVRSSAALSPTSRVPPAAAITSGAPTVTGPIAPRITPTFREPVSALPAFRLTGKRIS